MDYLYAVMLFAVSSSVTPGPNNIMLMSSGLNFGVKRSIPLLCGICVGFALMLLLVGFGFAQLFEIFPQLHFVIKCAGVVYLLYLAYLIAKSAATPSASQAAEPFSFIKGALFQWVNGKAWVVATGAIATFTNVGSHFHSQNLLIATTFLLVSFPCVALWLAFGSGLQSVLNNVDRRRYFNFSMAGLLVLSVLPVMAEIFQFQQ